MKRLGPGDNPGRRGAYASARARPNACRDVVGVSFGDVEMWRSHKPLDGRACTNENSQPSRRSRRPLPPACPSDAYPTREYCVHVFEELFVGEQVADGRVATTASNRLFVEVEAWTGEDTAALEAAHKSGKVGNQRVDVRPSTLSRFLRGFREPTVPIPTWNARSRRCRRSSDSRVSRRLPRIGTSSPARASCRQTWLT